MPRLIRLLSDRSDSIAACGDRSAKGVTILHPLRLIGYRPVSPVKGKANIQRSV